LAAASCAAHGAARPAGDGSARAARLAPWPEFIHVHTPLDFAGPVPGGPLVLAANGRLWRVGGGGQIRPWASAYRSPGGGEPYIAVARPGHPGCGFGRRTVYALRLVDGPGLVAIPPRGPVHRFAEISTPGLLDGIAFDEQGGFGYRLLVTINSGLQTTVDAVSCHGRVTTITRRAPRVEGGIVVARRPFGRFGGDLIAPEEQTGQIWAISPRGRSILIARSGLPAGRDIGVESEVQVPGGRYALLGADRLTPGNPHPGDDALLRIGSLGLRKAGVRPFDVLVGTEGGARLQDLRCQARCSVREIAAGPAVAHLEGHLGVISGVRPQVPNPTRWSSLSTRT
jgi:hypothetical protein